MDKKKLAAAMAAVTAYIKAGEAAAFQNPGQGESMLQEPALNGAAPRMNLWGVTGRQTLMQANTMMQLRMFK